MFRHTSMLAAAVVIASCGGTRGDVGLPDAGVDASADAGVDAAADSGVSLGPCAPRVGTYDSTGMTTGGTCGDLLWIPLMLATPTAETTLRSTCTGSITETPDGCTVHSDVSCDNGIHSQNQETLTRVWSMDGTTGDETLTLVEHASDGSVYCMGTYTAHLTRR